MDRGILEALNRLIAATQESNKHLAMLVEFMDKAERRAKEKTAKP